QASGLRIERAKTSIICPSDEQQATGGGDRSALTKCAGVVDALGFQLVTDPERNAPRYVAGTGVDGHQLGPWRLLTRPLLGGVPETRIHRAESERTEAAVRHLVTVLCLVHAAHSADVPRVHEDVAEPGIHRDAAVIRAALLAGENDP